MEIRIVIITGCSGAGKDHLCDKIEITTKELATNNNQKIDFHIINSDNFYKDLSFENHFLADNSKL